MNKLELEKYGINFNNGKATIDVPWFKNVGERLFNKYPFIWNEDFLNTAIINNDKVSELILRDSLYLDSYFNKDKYSVNLSNCIGRIKYIDIYGVTIEISDDYLKTICDIISSGKRIVATNSYMLYGDAMDIVYLKTYIGYVEDSTLKYI